MGHHTSDDRNLCAWNRSQTILPHRFYLAMEHVPGIMSIMSISDHLVSFCATLNNWERLGQRQRLCKGTPCPLVWPHLVIASKSPNWVINRGRGQYCADFGLVINNYSQGGHPHLDENNQYTHLQLMDGWMSCGDGLLLLGVVDRCCSVGTLDMITIMATLSKLD